MLYKNIAGRFFGLVTKHACDRRTDGQNYDSQDRASIASRGKNESTTNRNNGVEPIGPPRHATKNQLKSPGHLLQNTARRNYIRTDLDVFNCTAWASFR